MQHESNPNHKESSNSAQIPRQIKQVMLKLLRHMQLLDNIKGNRDYNFLGNDFMSFLHR